MKTKVAKTNFILLTILALLALVLCVVSFDIPWTTSTFNGFAKSMNLGLDFGDGVSAIYSVSNDDFYSKSTDAMATDAVSIIQKIIDDMYGDGKAEVLQDNKVKLTLPDKSIPNSVLLTSLEMKAASGEEAETYVTGGDIKKVEYRMNGTTHGVYITFTKEGKTKFANLTREASSGNGIYIYLNRDYSSSVQPISISEEITTGYVFLSSSSKSAAQEYAKQLNNTRYGLNLTLEGSVVTVHSNFAVWQKVVFAVLSCLLLVGSFVFLIVKHRHLGLIASLCLLIMAEISVIAFSLIPQIRLTFVSYLGMVLGYVLAFAVMEYILNSSAHEYACGKKLPASLKTGYSKAAWSVVDILVVTMIISLVSFIFGNVTFTSFFAPISIMLISIALCMLGLYRWFVYMYLSINPGKAKYVNFVRKEGVDEIK